MKCISDISKYRHIRPVLGMVPQNYDLYILEKRPAGPLCVSSSAKGGSIGFCLESFLRVARREHEQPDPEDCGRQDGQPGIQFVPVYPQTTLEHWHGTGQKPGEPTHKMGRIETGLFDDLVPGGLCVVKTSHTQHHLDQKNEPERPCRNAVHDLDLRSRIHRNLHNQHYAGFQALYNKVSVFLQSKEREC